MTNSIGIFPSELPKGLLKLPRSIVTSSHVQPVNLPTKCNDDLENIDGIAMGIGLSSFNGSFDFLLRHTHIRTMSSADCANRLNNHKRSDSMLCAEPNSGQGIFRGDSGMKELFAYFVLQFYVNKDTFSYTQVVHY